MMITLIDAYIYSNFQLIKIIMYSNTIAHKSSLQYSMVVWKYDNLNLCTLAQLLLPLDNIGRGESILRLRSLPKTVLVRDLIHVNTSFPRGQKIHIFQS